MAPKQFVYLILLYLFCWTDYPHVIQLSKKGDSNVLITFNARNEHDRRKFGQDLEESIAEMDEMEQIRIENELDRQKNSRRVRNLKSDSSNRKTKSSSNNQLSTMKNNQSNSLLDINDEGLLRNILNSCSFVHFL